VGSDETFKRRRGVGGSRGVSDVYQSVDVRRTAGRSLRRRARYAVAISVDAAPAHG
jgi:hypothetical protein